MAERKKLELELNKTVSLELLFDEPITGQSRYGPYWMYTLKNSQGEELLYFAPEEVNEQIKSLRKVTDLRSQNTLSRKEQRSLPGSM